MRMPLSSAALLCMRGVLKHVIASRHLDVLLDKLCTELGMCQMSSEGVLRGCGGCIR